MRNANEKGNVPMEEVADLGYQQLLQKVMGTIILSHRLAIMQEDARLVSDVELTVAEAVHLAVD